MILNHVGTKQTEFNSACTYLVYKKSTKNMNTGPKKLLHPKIKW